MDTLNKTFIFNQYSKSLVAEFNKLKINFNTKKLRNSLFENKNYHKFLAIIQNKFLKSLENDKNVNELLSTALEGNKFKYKLLNNTFEQRLQTKQDILYDYPESFHSSFMSKKIVKRLDTNRIFIVDLSYNYCGVKLELGFYCDTKWFEHFSAEKYSCEKSRLYQKIIRILRRIIFVIDFFQQHTCNKDEVLKFNFFLLKPDKKLPKKRMQKLSGENINSGYTSFYSDKKKTIIIYRDEELEKLVIHEMIHFFYLDFTHLSIDLSKYLNVSPNVEFIPNESYTEFITSLMHTGIMSIENEFKLGMKRSKKANSILDSNKIYTKGIDKKIVFYQSIELLYHEILFGYFQCGKILFQYNIDDVDKFFKPYSSQDKVFFWQISCILSYFFIKVSLLTNLDKSIEFFINNQTDFKINTIQHVKNGYENLIKESLNNLIFKQNIQKSIDKLNSIIFNPAVQKQITDSCRSKSKSKKRNSSSSVEKCSRKLKSTYKTHNSLKKQYKKLSNIVMTTRMSLFEL